MRLHFVVRFLAIMVLAVPFVHGQSNNGRIEGTVQDPSGALIPGVQMTATNVRTQFKAEVLSGEHLRHSDAPATWRAEGRGAAGDWGGCKSVTFVARLLRLWGQYRFTRYASFFLRWMALGIPA